MFNLTWGNVNPSLLESLNVLMKGELDTSLPEKSYAAGVIGTKFLRKTICILFSNFK